MSLILRYVNFYKSRRDIKQAVEFRDQVEVKESVKETEKATAKEVGA